MHDKYFETLLSSRGHVFEIDTELKVRKYLECISDYRFEFQKNNDIYGYDLLVNFYNTTSKDWIKSNITFIEIEVSETWVNEYPPHWKYYSFLARKVFEFDKAQNKFTKRLKPDADKTIYLVFNKSMTDCFCSLISDTVKYCKLCVTNTLFADVYRETFYRVSLDSDLILRGKNNCMRYISGIITNLAHT